MNLESLKFDNSTGLIPAIIQDFDTGLILMHAYMNLESLNITLNTKKITFFSRSRKELWTKGETSGNYLNLISIATDCDKDTLLIKAKPEGPTCHLGTTSCFQKDPKVYSDLESSSSVTQSIPQNLNFLNELESTIAERFNSPTHQKSYIKSLIDSGLDKIIQKVGEEAVETVIAAKNQDKEQFIYESSDLLFHLLVLLKAKDLSLKDLVNELKKRQG